MAEINTSRKKSLKEFIKEKRNAKKQINVSQFEHLCIEDPYTATYEFKKKIRLPTAYGYAPGLKHKSPWDPEYPECPERASAIHESVSSLLKSTKQVTPADLLQISDNEFFKILNLTHSLEHTEEIEKLCINASEKEAAQYDAIFYNGKDSYDAAITAAKMAIAVTKLVAEGECQNGFANIRPPGHHASGHDPNGYCLFNNVAVAAQYLLENKLAERILIVDYDVHHGQGTQKTFYDSNKVLYYSIHRYEHGTFWPNLKDSNYDYIGSNEGEGFNINVPLNDTKLTDYDYLAIIYNTLIPVAYEYNPSIILVSAGYDACIGCPEGEMYISPSFYSHLINGLTGLAEGKIIVLLEGGYCLPSLAEAGLRTLKTLLGYPCDPLHFTKYINPSVCDSINNVKIAHRNYWKCFQLDPTIEINDMNKYDRFNYHVATLNYCGTPETAPFLTRNCYPVLSLPQQNLVKAYIKYLQEERYTEQENVVGYVINTSSHKHFNVYNKWAYESQNRIEDIINKFEDFNLFNKMYRLDVSGTDFDNMLNKVNHQIEKIHTDNYMHKLKLEGLTQDRQQSDVFVAPESDLVCRHSIAVLCLLCTEIVNKQISHGVGIIRPPGHHAKKEESSGFCLVNNVVIVADYILSNTPFIKKVLIVDFDIHHGDGTQELTYNRNDIMYISMHRYDNGQYFPMKKKADFTCMGSDIGFGYNINIPFNTEKMGNSDYIHIWLKIVMPLSYSYNPDIILISAGFDAGVHDPLGNYNVAPETFGHMVNLIKAVAPTVLILEGGYNPETTSLSMVNCVKALLGLPLPVPQLNDVKEETKKTMENVCSLAKIVWPILTVNKSVDTRIRRGTHTVS